MIFTGELGALVSTGSSNHKVREVRKKGPNCPPPAGNDRSYNTLDVGPTLFELALDAEDTSTIVYESPYPWALFLSDGVLEKLISRGNWTSEVGVTTYELARGVVTVCRRRTKIPVSNVLPSPKEEGQARET